MTFSDTWEPPQFNFSIPIGAAWHLEWPPFVDSETGEVFDFTTDPEGTWSATLQIRDGAGNDIVLLSTGNGRLVLDAAGVVSADLSADDTTALPVTRRYAQGTTGGVLYADLVLTDPADGSLWVMASGRGAAFTLTT